MSGITTETGTMAGTVRRTGRENVNLTETKNADGGVVNAPDPGRRALLLSFPRPHRLEQSKIGATVRMRDLGNVARVSEMSTTMAIMSENGLGARDLAVRRDTIDTTDRAERRRNRRRPSRQASATIRARAQGGHRRCMQP